MLRVRGCKLIGTLEKEDRKRQEVWAVKDSRISHLLVGYEADNRVRYVTALARTVDHRFVIRKLPISNPRNRATLPATTNSPGR